TYSGGLKKKLSIAASLIHDPKVLILDEPTTGLDPSSRRDVWSILEELKRSGKTILMATHYMEEAEALADRVAIINEGSVIAVGSPKELKKKVGELTIVEVEVANPRPGIKEVLRPLSTGGRVLIKDSTIRVYLDEYEVLLPKVAEALLTAGVRPVTIRVTEPTLEDVFLKLTGRGLT
ncbi:MAG: AAA family ATPase, partial [Desulfurococcales archaeon]|nr:AAA family ATPase [Desulfurococcales archaeon]